MLPTTWVDVFKELLNSLPHDERFRSAIRLDPHGPADASEEMESVFDELMAAFADGSDLEDALDGMARRFVATRLPATSGQLKALQNPAPITLQTTLQRHPDILWRVESDGDQAHLHFHGKTTSVPWTAIQALRSIAEGAPFVVADIPGDLSEDLRCQLAQHLLDEGFLIRQ